jgi:hypothetical protein
MSSRPPVNPYIAGSPVTGAEMFYGRDDVFAFIRRNLIGQHRDSPILLYGQRRTGKTSVLYQLHRQLGPGYRCIFIDLHGLDLTGMGNFLLDIANSISRGLQREHQLTVPVPDEEIFLANPRSVFEIAFLDAVWSALGEDHLVLMIDEAVRLDEEVKAGRIERGIFDYLRHLMQHHAQLNFVFSLGSSMEEMRKEYAFLFSVSLYHRISFLETAAARDLIIEPVREYYQVAPEAVTKIIRITSGHPYYTQLVCHCLFDQWSRSPKPVMTDADVDAVLSDAIELGSPNLTYVWEDSTPEEQAVMAGMAAAMHGEACSVTLDDAQQSWQAVDVLLPAREGTRALHSLAGREIVAGSKDYSFTIDLQRLWLEKHRRLDWAKEELAQTAQQWNRSVRTTRRDRYLAIAAAVVLLVGYLTAAAVAHVYPFSTSASSSTSTQDLTTQLLLTFPGDVNRDDCHAAPPPSQWKMPGLIQGLHCTDPGLRDGNVYAYQLDNAADYNAAWQNFNTWWGFLPASATKTCPPTAGAPEGKVNLGLSAVQECGLLPLSADYYTVPAYAYGIPNSYTLVIAEARSGSSFSALTSWLTHKTNPTVPKLAAGLAPLALLLPSDMADIATDCSPLNKPYNWSMPGLVTALSCRDPNLPQGSLLNAFQLGNTADFETAWHNFNTWWPFNISNAGPDCPPGSSGEGTFPFNDKYFPGANGQVLECEVVHTAHSGNLPGYAWAYPTDDVFIIAECPAGTSFATLNYWWTHDSAPGASPSPSP